MRKGQLEASESLAQQCLRAAQAEGDRSQLCVAERMVGIAHLVTGDFTRALEHCSRAAEHYDEALHAQLANRLAHDLLVAALCFRALALWALGHPEQARRTIAEVLAHARRIDHAPSLAYAHWHAGIMGMLMLRDDTGLAEHANGVVALSSKHGFSLWECGGRATQGWLEARAGGGDAAISKIKAALATMRRTGARVNDTVFLALLGEAQAAAGDAQAALASLAEGIEIAETSRQAFWSPELYRLQAAIRLRSTGDRGGAETALRKSLAVAEEQKALSWQLRAATDLARLLADDGKPDQAHRLLGGIYHRFQEGFDTPDLRDARSLMDTIGRRLAGGPTS
jgi:predicted ATPase